MDPLFWHRSCVPYSFSHVQSCPNLYSYTFQRTQLQQNATLARHIAAVPVSTFGTHHYCTTQLRRFGPKHFYQVSQSESAPQQNHHLSKGSWKDTCCNPTKTVNKGGEQCTLPLHRLTQGGEGGKTKECLLDSAKCRFHSKEYMVIPIHSSGLSFGRTLLLQSISLPFHQHFRNTATAQTYLGRSGPEHIFTTYYRRKARLSRITICRENL